MKIPRNHFPAVVVLLLLGGAQATAQQPRDRAQPPSAAGSDVAALANGWAALAAGRSQDAIKVADGLLTERPGDHRAVDLKIEALAPAEPLRALDAYEAWLGRVRLEDVFLLVPVARGTLLQISAGKDRALALQALQRLAQNGDAQDTARLQQFLKSGTGLGGDATSSPQLDIQLALRGDAAAAERLTSPEAARSVPPQSLAKALTAAGPAAIPMLRFPVEIPGSARAHGRSAQPWKNRRDRRRARPQGDDERPRSAELRGRRARQARRSRWRGRGPGASEELGARHAAARGAGV